MFTSGRTKLAVVALALLPALVAPAEAQFGQNKISYTDFDWRVYASPHFDVHYYPETEPFLDAIVSAAESAYAKIGRDLDHELRFRVPLITYKTHGEFQQTNVTLSEVPDFVQAFAEPVQYRMVLPIDLPPDQLYELIAHELTHIFQYSYFFEGYLGRALRSRPPTWLMEGMASYLAEDESNFDRMAIRDAVANGYLPPLEALDYLSFLTYRYGHALFDFMEEEHGLEGVRTFLFEFKKVLLTGNLSKAIEEAFGYDVDEFNRRFNRYLRRRYYPVLLEKKSPDDYGTQLGDRKLRSRFVFSPSLSPSGELIAALANPGMELDLLVLTAEDGSRVRNVTKGYTNDYIELSSDAFDGRRDLSWSPASDLVAVFARRENKWPLLVFDAISGKKVREFVFDDIYQCAAPTFSPDGKRIAFEGNREGVVDLFEVDLDSGAVRNLTQDDFFDTNPWYGPEGDSLLYNRRIGESWKIFAVDLADASKKRQLTFGISSDIQPSYSRDGENVYFSSDRNEHGIFNLYSLDLTSGDVRQYTDVVGGCFAPVEMGERGGDVDLVFTAYFAGRFQLYRMPLHAAEHEIVAAARLAEPVEAEPFEPTVRLTTDEDKKRPYKLRWDIEAPSVTVGVADDGTLLSDSSVRFSDLLGNHRVAFSAVSVSDFWSYNAAYFNLKNRYNWGARYYDYRDYFVDGFSGDRIERRYSERALAAFVQYPFSRYYRVDLTAGLQDSSYNQLVGIDPLNGAPDFQVFDDRLGFVSLDFVGDTTRYQSFGPFQGKRFSVGATYGPNISGDFDGDLLQYNLDFRAYKQATRRSLLAFRAATLYGDGTRQNTYGFGGINYLRGFEFREFYGSRLAWANVEFRFPLIDELRFPVFAVPGIRGFFFFDVGAAWFDGSVTGDDGDPWYDPLYGVIRADYSGGVFVQPEVIPFQFWDSENDRLLDGRASYGVGFQFFFIGGLQFNWTWARVLPYSQYVLANENGVPIEPRIIEVDPDGFRSDFYIQFDW